jgi:RHS repeat-associated protein
MELQDELIVAWYDYVASQYDPALGKFLSVDPLSEIGRRWSPYVYANDNPTRFIDPDGMVAEDKIRLEEYDNVQHKITMRYNEEDNPIQSRKRSL